MRLQLAGGGGALDARSAQRLGACVRATPASHADRITLSASTATALGGPYRTGAGKLGPWVQQTRPLRDREPVALDGKVVRGARTATQAAPQLLSVSTHTTQETLVQVRISDKTNEIPVAQELLPHLTVRGRVVTADALHTQTALAQCILAHGAAYLFTVKDNQPRLRAELAAYFADPRATMRSAQTIDRRRGRTDTRTLSASTRLNGYLRTYFPFPRLAQIARLIRTVRTAEKTTTETVYLITSSLSERTKLWFA